MDERENNIILFPDFQKLKEGVELLKAELSALLLERDELQYVICKNIETAYILKFGAIEYKAYEAQCAALRLKRKIELVQARINRQEKIVISQIEQLLDKEFAEYRKRLNEQIEKMNKALERSRCEVLTEEESKELKRLYHNIVKRLHPDVNPNATEIQIQLLNNAISAYKDGDLDSLRIIELMVADRKLPEQTQDAMSIFVKENERLKSVLASIQKQIAEIKSCYPYTVKEIIEDPQKGQERLEEIESILQQYEDLIEIYKAKLAHMLGDIQ